MAIVDAPETRQVFQVLGVAKLMSFLLLGPLVSGGGVIVGFATRRIANELQLALSTPQAMLAERPWLGAIAGVPVLLCGILGLLDRRRRMLWSILGTLSFALGALAVGLVFVEVWTHFYSYAGT